MDTKVKKICPNCSQLYYLKSVFSPNVSNLPLFLTCGHSMCESCIRNILKFEEPIECKICQCDVNLEKADLALINQNKIKLYQFFPVNLLMLGELSLQLLEQNSEFKEQPDKDFFINLQSILANTDKQGKCLECHNPTSKLCQQCATVLCETCFNKSHKNFIIFKAHVLVSIDEVLSTANGCKIHKGKSLDYYCQDCKKSICMDCLVVGGDKSCKNHNVVSMQEVNDNFLEELIDITPKVDETFRRLTKTAVEVGHLLLNLDNETGFSSQHNNLLCEVKQHFSKLAAAVQKHEQEVLNIILKVKYSEKESLHKAKHDLEVAIKKSRTVLNSINISTNPEKTKQLNLSVLLDEAKQIVEAPWYLTKDKSDDPLKVAVNEDLCSLVSDYIHLEGNASSVYKLRSSSELGDIEVPPPPPAPVFPPELPKDVRQLTTIEKKAAKGQGPVLCKNVPNYRAKSSSVSSLNSVHSDSSDKYSFSNLYSDSTQNYQKPVVQQVQPFAESQHPKQLHEGSQEIIYITHIVDPHNFFVQRACHQELVKEMLREFRNAGSMPKPSLNHVTEGKLYLVHHKADNMWQRCRVVSINRKDPKNPKFLVFCIDFGSTETVTIDKLRLLPPARVQSPYPLASNCSLANCVPKTTWTSDDAYLIQNIVDNKQAIIHVRHIRSTANYSVTLECDVTTFDDGVSLAHALVFHERAKMTKPKVPYPKIHCTTEKPKIFPSKNDLKPKSIEEVYIIHIVSPDKFYVRKRHLMETFNKLCDDLEQEYSLNSNVGLIYLPEPGMSCVVYVEKLKDEYPGWARGIVQELPGRLRVSLFLPDIGDTVLVHWTKLRQIHPKFTISKALAIECHLAGVSPPQRRWSAGSVLLLRRYCGRVLRLVAGGDRRAPGVTLLDHSDPDNVVCINNEMIKHKFAVSFGLFMFDKDSELENQVYPNKLPSEAPQQHPRPAEQIQVLQRKAPKIREEQLDAKDKGPLRLEAKVLHYMSPSLLYVSLVHQQKAFSELYEQIQKYYSEKKGQGKETWAVGERCCALCRQSATWRRGTVVELQQGGAAAKVFYSDFACVEALPTADLRQLAPELAAVGDAAVKCHLSGIVPADASDDWPTLTKEYLKELLDVYQRIFITKLGNFKNKSMPIEIWVYHTIQGDALEPNRSEWRCLNKKIIEQGLGIPDKSQEMSTGPEDLKDDMLSFLKNVTGSVDEWLQLEPLPTKPIQACLPKAEAKSSVSNSPTIELSEDPPNEKDTIFITDWLPAEPLPCKEFTGMPTYIDNDGIIYLHDIAQQDTLDLIRKALDVRFKSPDPKAKYAKWSVGEPCIALFFLDNRFYRGRVLEVNKENSSCLIHYVDYGNEESCSFENLRKSTALYQIPVQAHKCTLGRIRPVDAQWDRTTLDYIHKSIVEKQCFVKVLGESIEGVTPIDLKYDKLWINDHLVDFEMASYTDGSRPVVRKYLPDNAMTKLRDDGATVDLDSSGPDYIVEEDNDSASHASYKSLDGKDWNELVEREEAESNEGRFLVYPKNELTTFRCNVAVITDVRSLELSVVHAEEEAAQYAALADSLAEGGALPALGGVFEHKACAARYPADGRWYRAELLQASADAARLKVRYVDYGNVEVLARRDVRELPARLAALPPATLRARLAAAPAAAADPQRAARLYADTFLDKGPFSAAVRAHDDDGTPLVELRDDSGHLVYQHLIESGLLVVDD